MPESERDIELRRMLVATAAAAPPPVRSRRRWSVVAPIAAFALAGALTGAVSAAALNASVESPPVSVDTMVQSFIHDDTQLFGTPVVVAAQGDSMAPLGPVPDGAVELAIAFRCEDAGRFDVLIDGNVAMTTVCEAPISSSGGGGSYFTVDDAPAHTLAVSAAEGARYVVWASWAARADQPGPSPEQAAATADGEVTRAEYLAQFDRYSTCMTAAGHPLQGVDTSGTIIRYVNAGAAVSSGAEDRCYAQEFVQVDLAWQGGHPR